VNSINTIIRTIESYDYEAIYNLLTDELGYTNLNKNDAFTRFDKIKNHKSYETFVAVYENKVIGFIGIFRGIAFNVDGNGEYLQVIALAVNSKFQNRGTGSKLLNAVDDYAKSNNIDTISLNSGFHREKAHTFYEKQGFVKKSYSFIKNEISE